jgi:LAO/AO transport system kinase
LVDGILKSDRITLAKAITLVESSLPSDQQIANNLLDAIIPFSGKSVRIGITGVPGVGKSTFIEALGKHLTGQHKKIAVLTIDPTSQLTQGSILGDKTRMEELARNNLAFIRPSPAGEKLGGVTHKTREVILLCEAAGFEVIIVETVGVGQSEVAVKNMVDYFLLLMLAGAGDELQGIKKGITEMADAIVITKADGENIAHARRAQADFQQAVHLSDASHATKVLTCSALTGTGIDSVWNTIEKTISERKQSGDFDENRKAQKKSWFNEYFHQLLSLDLTRRKNINEQRADLLKDIDNESISLESAARKLLDLYHQSIRTAD